MTSTRRAKWRSSNWDAAQLKTETRDCYLRFLGLQSWITSHFYLSIEFSLPIMRVISEVERKVAIPPNRLVSAESPATRQKRMIGYRPDPTRIQRALSYRGLDSRPSRFCRGRIPQNPDAVRNMRDTSTGATAYCR